MKKATMKKSGANEATGGSSPSRHIDAKIKELGSIKHQLRSVNEIFRRAKAPSKKRETRRK